MTYFDRFKFTHPMTIDFVERLNQVIGQKFNWSFDQVIYGTGGLDFRLEKISNPTYRTSTDMFSGDSTSMGDSVEIDPEDQFQDDEDLFSRYDFQVLVDREGDVAFQVEILVGFEDGRKV